MSSDQSSFLEQLSSWTSSLLALGWMSAGHDELEEADFYIQDLRQRGLLHLAGTLESFVSLLRAKATTDDADLATSFGRFLIALEMTRESAQLSALEA